MTGRQPKRRIHDENRRDIYRVGHQGNDPRLEQLHVGIVSITGFLGIVCRHRAARVWLGRSPEPPMSRTPEDGKGGGFFARLTHKHRKRKRRRHANPTLAETGGLPEARNRDKPPPAPPA